MRGLALAATLALSASLAAAPSTHAGGLGTPLVGTAWSGVTTADAAAVYWNPARLSAIEGHELQLGAGLIVAFASYERVRRAQYQYEDSFDFALPLDPADIDASKSGSAGEVSGDMLLPLGSVFASWRVHDRVTLGLGVYAAYGAVLDMPANGPQQWQVNDAVLFGVQVTPAISVQATDWLSIGAGFHLVIGALGLQQTIDLAGTSLLGGALANPPISQPNDFGSDAPPGVRELDVLSRPATVDQATALGASFNVGVALTPHPDWVIGLTYQHRTDLVLEGDARLNMDHDFFTTDLAYKGLQYPALVEGTAFVELTLPASLRLGLSWTPAEGTEIALQGGWVMYSAVEALIVTIESPDLELPTLGLGSTARVELPRDWNDSFEVELLLAHQVAEILRLGFRAGYHSPVSPDRTLDLASIDGHRLIGAAMVDVKISDTIALQGQVMLQHLIPHEVTNSDFDLGNGTYGLTIFHVGGALSLSL